MIDANLIWDGTVSAAGVLAGTAITVDRVSTNVIDMLVARDIGGDGLEAHVVITQAFLTTVSLQIAYQTSADNSAWVDVMLSPVVLVANLVAGATIFRYPVPLTQLNDVGAPNRYHRLSYDISTTATAGAVFAYMNSDRANFIPYPRGYSTSA